MRMHTGKEGGGKEGFGRGARLVVVWVQPGRRRILVLVVVAWLMVGPHVRLPHATHESRKAHEGDLISVNVNA